MGLAALYWDILQKMDILKKAAGGYKPACARLGTRLSDLHRFRENELKEMFMANLDGGYQISRYCLGLILFYGLGMMIDGEEEMYSTNRNPVNEGRAG